MPAWYVKHNDKKHGPWSSQQLKQAVTDGVVDATAQVWQEGFEDWQPITKIKGLVWPSIPAKTELMPALSHAPQLINPHPVMQQPPAPIQVAVSMPMQPQPAISTQQVVHVHMSGGKQWSRGVAMILSLIIPGLGQVYKGQIINGLVWFVLVIVGYIAFIVPGLILHILCILGAASGKNR